MDGIFVPNISFGPPVIASIRKKTKLFFDVHLMIKNPQRYIENFIRAGADSITIHLESTSRPKDAIQKIRDHDMKAGIAISPATPYESVLPYLDMVDMVLVMTVEPGFGGQKFMADMMPKLKQIRQMLDEVNPACHLEVDGGVDLVTGEVCKENGADVLVAGSAYFKATDKADFVKQIEK